ncbi:hypothetical protein K7432_013883 [Basidiobolus ranarum]|uniref:Amino acid adenylation domain-containing protein n=1 Tax=Basidiobolus ranarum TaxID=34480 RepID=A0ABR2VQ85_9FUNG
MTPFTHPKTYQLSAVQTEIWLAQQLNPESPIYNIAQFIEIPGIVDPTLFEEALSQVLMEAECMRLQFIKGENGVEQFVGPLNWTLPLIDVSTDANPQEAAEAWMRNDYEQPMNLQHGLKFRYALLKVATHRYLWYQCMHHIIFDGYGAVLVLQRAAQIYSALVKGTAAPKCSMKPLSFLLQSDIDYRNSSQFTKDQKYWLEHCKDWPEPVTLTGKKAVSVHLPIRQTIHYSSQSVSTLSSDPRRFTYAVIAVIAIYLHRWTGIEEVTLGFPVKARFGEDRHIPGTTSNVLPIRVTVQPGMSLSSLIEQVAQEVQLGLRHQRYRSEELRRNPRLGRNQHLYGPTINLMPFDRDVSFGQYQSTAHNLLTGPIDDLAINIYVGCNGGPLRIDFAANPTLYRADELIAHQRRILNLLDTLATNPSLPVTAVGIIDMKERQKLLFELNETTMQYPDHQCIHHLFEEQVALNPEATAIEYANQVLSYAELNSQANRLAHYLIELGVRPDERVAICVERSSAMIVGLLAILKAGGAYVPLDPAYPPERLNHILTDAAPYILLADASGRAALSKTSLASMTVLDPNILVGSLTTNPRISELSSHHLAYVIYTSGTTGTPKGVMIEHRNLTNLCIWHNSTFSVGTGSKSSLTARVAFDASVCEIWPAIIGGATLVIPDHSVSHDIPALLQWWGQENIDVSILVTPLAAIVLGENQLPQTLRYLLTGGDRFPYSPKSLPSGFAVMNVYGPTEITVLATSGQLKADDNQPHIGRPIANTRIYLLDPYGHPVPLGATGEMYIGGAGVARGYLNLPELTAERFLPDPFSMIEGSRMYKTGDLARYLPNGNLEFLGRNDSQVKIRGYRIELEEIEAHLVDHPQVREAMVLAMGDEGTRLHVAFRLRTR